MKKEKFNHVAFYGLGYKDELYYVTLKNSRLFKKQFGYSLLQDYGTVDSENPDVYYWVVKNCKFVGYVACVL